MSYRLTRKAQRDLENIYRYSLQNFGEAKADEYFDGISDFFTLLTEHPFIGQDYGFIKIGLRRSEYVSHSVYYRKTGKSILILRVLGKQQDPARHF